MVRLCSYHEQMEQPLHLSSTSELMSHLRILFLKVFKVLADLTSGDNFNLAPRKENQGQRDTTDTRCLLQGADNTNHLG